MVAQRCRRIAMTTPRRSDFIPAKGSAPRNCSCMARVSAECNTWNRLDTAARHGNSVRLSGSADGAQRRNAPAAARSSTTRHCSSPPGELRARKPARPVAVRHVLHRRAQRTIAADHDSDLPHTSERSRRESPPRVALRNPYLTWSSPAPKEIGSGMSSMHIIPRDSNTP